MATRFEKLKRMNEERKIESPIEEALCRWLCLYGLYGITQFQVGKYRADIAFPEKKLIIECDGKKYHTGIENEKRDSERDRWLREQGWRVMRFTGKKIYAEPKQIIYRIVYEQFPEQKNSPAISELFTEIEKRYFTPKRLEKSSSERMEFYQEEMWDLYDEEIRPDEEDEVETNWQSLTSGLREKLKWLEQ